jgi:hypothetical protein
MHLQVEMIDFEMSSHHAKVMQVMLQVGICGVKGIASDFQNE